MPAGPELEALGLQQLRRLIYAVRGRKGASA